MYSGVRTPTVIRRAHIIKVLTKCPGSSPQFLPDLAGHTSVVPVPGEEKATVVGLDRNVATPVDQHVVRRGVGHYDPLLYLWRESRVVGVSDHPWTGEGGVGCGSDASPSPSRDTGVILPSTETYLVLPLHGHGV